MFRRLLAAAFALAACLLLLDVLAPAGALAADDTVVSVPIGDWVAGGSEILVPVIVGGLLWLVRKLPGGVVDVIRTMRAEQLLTKAVSYGVNAVAGAAKDKTLTVNVGNAVVAQAAQYAIDNGPGWLVGWLGGEAAIRQKIIARLSLDEAAAVALVNGAPVIVGKG